YVNDAGMHFYWDSHQRPTRLKDQRSGIDIHSAFQDLTDSDNIVVKGRRTAFTAIEAATDVEVVQYQASRRDDSGGDGCCSPIDFNAFGRRIAMHVQYGNTDPGGIEFLYSCI